MPYPQYFPCGRRAFGTPPRSGPFGLLGLDRIVKDAYRLDVNLHHVPWSKEHRRRSGHTDPCRGAGRDDVTRRERHEL